MASRKILLLPPNISSFTCDQISYHFPDILSFSCEQISYLQMKGIGWSKLKLKCSVYEVDTSTNNVDNDEQQMG